MRFPSGCWSQHQGRWEPRAHTCTRMRAHAQARVLDTIRRTAVRHMAQAGSMVAGMDPMQEVKDCLIKEGLGLHECTAKFARDTPTSGADGLKVPSPPSAPSVPVPRCSAPPRVCQAPCVNVGDRVNVNRGQQTKQWSVDKQCSQTNDARMQRSHARMQRSHARTLCQQSMLARAATVPHDSLPKSSSGRIGNGPEEEAAESEARMAAHHPVHPVPPHGIAVCVVPACVWYAASCSVCSPSCARYVISAGQRADGSRRAQGREGCKLGPCLAPACRRAPRGSHQRPCSASVDHGAAEQETRNKRHREQANKGKEELTWGARDTRQVGMLRQAAKWRWCTLLRKRLPTALRPPAAEQRLGAGRGAVQTEWTGVAWRGCSWFWGRWVSARLGAC